MLFFFFNLNPAFDTPFKKGNKTFRLYTRSLTIRCNVTESSLWKINTQMLEKSSIPTNRKVSVHLQYLHKPQLSTVSPGRAVDSRKGRGRHKFDPCAWQLASKTSVLLASISLSCRGKKSQFCDYLLTRKHGLFIWNGLKKKKLKPFSLIITLK